MKVNFDLKMQSLIDGLNGKPKLLLHSCCAPCSSSCIERIKEFFDVTVFYYNPNIDTKEEFCHRESEQKRLCEKLGVGFLSDGYNPEEFYSFVKGLENEKEGGARCEKCFYLRLKRTAEQAKKSNYDYFTTTLTLSPLKNSELINSIGETIEEETGVKFLPSDFKKRNGYLRSIELSREYGLYRQNYCGCEFSKNKNLI